ncbi:hypothetical protein ABB37_00346 [Leptomonas pyrrhocoris]|uniref:EF-hand domain-containing protein n=1 Tax=Leptomonas pyrrhocoris TaxID=157538 RepID=A0A0M9GAE9_LEPPY|nr:hypothetical protein ABB37_00346 [Leptomonas pyrrhocoris]KPA86079.1 hypothetical protein ABB37_00346 [Leptomonas pyrrhocoris]|eukprot:XP_015664518.1 hypothetical protein ABB37_00346 [Leptomonas pyrrhocoris]
MAPVDVERVYSVFNVFAVNPTTNSSSRAAKEPYIPVHFLAVAAREVGFYPTTAAVHQFVKAVPTASAGAVTFAAFLQFCEDVAYTNRPGRSAIYRLVDDLDTPGGGLISRREFFLLLTNGSADISDGEITAVMELLDPARCGYVELKNLAALLLEQCQRQQRLSQASRSRSRSEGRAKPVSSAGEQQRQSEGRRHQHHHHSHRNPHFDSPPEPEAEQPGTTNGHRSLGDRADDAPPKHRVRRFAAAGTRRSEEREVSGAPAPSSAVHVAAGAAGARDRSFKRTDSGSNGEVAYRKFNSLYHRADTFERTHTSMTVDVDCPLSANGTAMRHNTNGDAAHTPSPLSRRAHASSGTPQSPSPKAPATAPPPLGPASGAGSHQKVQQTVKAQAKRENQERRWEGEDVLHLHPQDESEDEANSYSRAEGTTAVQLEKSEQQPSKSPVETSQLAPEVTTSPPPQNPAKAKKTTAKCCTMF